MLTMLTVTFLLLALLGTLPETLDYTATLWTPAMLADERAAWTEQTAAWEADRVRWEAELAEVVRLRHVAVCRAWLSARAEQVEAMDAPRGSSLREVGPRRPTTAQARFVRRHPRFSRPMVARLQGFVAYWRTLEAGPACYVGPTRERLWDAAPRRSHVPPTVTRPTPRVMLRDTRGRWFNAMAA